jgi:hypothetical protein
MRTVLPLTLAAAVALAGPLAAAPPAKAPEPLVERVRLAIDRGVRFLKQEERGRGKWEAQGRSGGFTALAVLALLNCGVPADDEVVRRGLNYLRDLPPQDTYVVGLQTMVFAEAGQARDKELVQRNVDWLLGTRVRKGGELIGWSYGRGLAASGLADNSNSQYAMLGLNAGKQAGAKIDAETWKEIQTFYQHAQQPDGGWNYMNHSQKGSASLTMTTAGFCSLHIAGLELSKGRQGLGPDGVAARCGQYEEDRSLAAAMKWIGGHFTFRPRGNYIFYNIYGLERAGRLSGQRFLGGHDWYREGCEYLVGQQREDGSWFADGGGADSWPVVSSSFALLFLSKGRTPVLISKLAYGRGEYPGWNNKHNDCRYLAEYASRELFKNKPMLWQVYDARDMEALGPEKLLEETAELLQSPVLFMNGHDAPRFSEAQKAVLKKYLEEGGFLFAEACCGREAFDTGFRALMKELFPDNPLRPLDEGHPVWRAHTAVPPGRLSKLEGIDLGCKTVVVYSPQPLAGWYEENQWDPAVHRGSKGPEAFRLAGNIIAYATGLEPPRPRLSKVEVVDDRNLDRKPPRGYLKVAQLRHEGDWQPAPKAMRNLMLFLRERAKLDVSLQKEEVRPGDPDFFNFRLTYMHGRGVFSYTPDEIAAVRANLMTGGTLFADACCGREAFDRSFRALADKLIPGAKLEPIPLNDELYSRANAGEAIAQVRRRLQAGGDFQAVEPALEGVKYQGRWVVIYSKADIGCALEKHQSSDCLGHDNESALRLGAAAVLYSLKR